MSTTVHRKEWRGLV